MDATVAIPLAVLIVGTFGFLYQVITFRAGREDVLQLRREKANQEYVGQLETRLATAESALQTCRVSENNLRVELNQLRADLVESMREVRELKELSHAQRPSRRRKPPEV